MKLMSKFIFAGLLFLPSISNAQIPRYDVESYCKSVADMSGGSSMIFNGCIEMEQEAYDDLKQIWLNLSQKQKKYCDEVGQVSGGSYSILKGCLDMELEASSSTPKFKY